MPRLLTILSIVVALAGGLYQFALRDIIFDSYGIGRIIQPIEDFPYQCRRITHDRLQACEDLWLDDEARVLYAACAGTEGRLAWNPAMGNLNSSGRRPGGSEIVALDIDKPGSDGLFGLRAIRPQGYVGATGDKSLDSVGFTAQVVDESTIQIYIVNHRPPVNAKKELIDAISTGSNATIEVFEMKRGASNMKHLRTIWSPDQVWSPNRVAVVGDGDFVVTNDHGAKVGLRKELESIIGGGNVAYCAASGACHVASPRMKFPNGLARGNDGLIYVPGSVDGAIRVFELQQDKSLKQVEVIHTHHPLDNIAIDALGDLYVAAFPNLNRLLRSVAEPFKHEAPSTIFRISKKSGQYQVEKVVEDAEGKIISGATTAVHDVKTGRLFIGAAVSPYIVICDPVKSSE